VRDRASGTTFKEISGKGMKEVPIPVPPLPEQRRIVAAIEEHFSRLDAAEASVSSASDRSKMSLQAGLRGLLDSSGNRHRLAEVCSHIVDCEHSTAKFVPTGVPCVDTTNVEPFRLAPDRFRFVSETTYIERIRRIEPTEGDVIFTREGTIGSAAMVPPGLRLCLGQRVAILRPSTSLDSQYLELALNSLLVRQQYRPLIQGTTAPHLNMRDIRALSIPVPSIQDQKAIVVVAQQLLSAHTLADMAIGQAKRRSAALRRSILAAAFSGRLVPQDPSDEPASALLERIAAERETSKPTRKKKAAS
jgi:type I restriction enzyme S subunit